MNLPSIPDNFNKILLLISLGLMFYCYLEVEKEIKVHKDILRISKSELSNQQFKIAKIGHELVYNVNELNFISKINKIDIPYVISSDKDLEINYNISSLQNAPKSVQDTIRKLIKKHNLDNLEFKLVDKELYNLKKEVDSLVTRKNILDGIYPLIICAFIIFIISILNLRYENNIRVKLLESELKKNPKHYDCCQSCAKQFNSIITYGTNSDMSLNKSFCQECFVAGNFTSKYSNLNEVIQEIKSNNKLNFFTKLHTSTKANFLDRWKTNPY